MKSRERKGLSQADMAARLGITPAALWDRLNSKRTKDISVTTLNEMAKMLDYKVLIVPRSTRIPDEGYGVE